jgi:hypothetical protein
MCGLMILEHIKVKISMARHLWDIEFDRVYKEILREYIDDGYDIAEAKTLAKKDTKEIMQEQLDFVEELYDNTLNDLD